jgi:hypothetical protein
MQKRKRGVVAGDNSRTSQFRHRQVPLLHVLTGDGVPTAAFLLLVGCANPLSLRPSKDSGSATDLPNDGSSAPVPPNDGASDGGAPDAAAAEDYHCACPEQVEPDVVRLPLECWCPAGNCIGTIDDLRSPNTCKPGGLAVGVASGIVAGTQGCGRITVVLAGFADATLTFDQQSGQLIGVYEFNAMPSNPCHTHVYLYGDTANSAPDAGLDCIPMACAPCPQLGMASCF